MVNNIKNNTISEIFAKTDLNTLNEIKNARMIKYKKRTPGQKELLNLFNDLSDTILTNKTLMSSKNENENKNKNENENNETLMSSNDDDHNEDNENQNENNDENNKTLMSSKEENENENKNDHENEDDDETIRDLNDILDEIIDKSKSFEEQIKSLKKRKDLKGFWPYWFWW